MHPTTYSPKSPLDNTEHAPYHIMPIGRTDMPESRTPNSTTESRIPRAIPMHAPHILPPPPPPPPPLLVPTTA